MHLSDKLTDKLVNMKLIKQEDKALYSYGFKQGFLLLLNMITLIIIGFLFGMIWQSVVFMIAYSLLRANAGGYHTSTPLNCYFFSLLMIIAVLWLIKLISWNGFMCFAMTGISSLIILKMAPVEDANKPFDQKEEEVFKKRTNIVLLILIVLIFLFWFIGFKQVSICISMGICLISIMLILGVIKNKSMKKTTLNNV